MPAVVDWIFVLKFKILTLEVVLLANFFEIFFRLELKKPSLSNDTLGFLIYGEMK